MMNPLIKLLYFLWLLGFAFNLNAQHLNTSYSQLLNTKSQVKASPKKIIADSDQFIFLLLSAKDQYFIQVIDKWRLESKSILPFKMNNDFYWGIRTLTSGFVVLFGAYDENNRNIINLYADKYDWDMNKEIDRKFIGSYHAAKEEFKIIVQMDGDDLAIIRSPVSDPNKNISIQYELLDKHLNPFFEEKKSIDMSFTSLYSNRRNVLRIFDGIYLTNTHTLIAPVFTQDASFPTGAFSFLFVDLKTNTNQLRKVSLKGLAFFSSVHLRIIGDEILFTGLYSDYEKHYEEGSEVPVLIPKTEISGAFINRIDMNKQLVTLSKQYPIDAASMNKLNLQNPILKSKISKGADSLVALEAGNGHYILRELIPLPDSQSFRFVGEFVHNYETAYVDAHGNLRTAQHSDRGSLFFFDIQAEQYSVEDIQVVRKIQKFSGKEWVYGATGMFVLSAPEKTTILMQSERLYDEENPNDLKGKAFDTKNAAEDYIIVDLGLTSSDYTLTYPKDSPKKLKADQKVQFDKLYLSSLDTSLYSVNIRRRVNWGLAALCIALTPAALIGPIIWQLSRNEVKRPEDYTIARIQYRKQTQ